MYVKTTGWVSARTPASGAAKGATWVDRDNNYAPGGIADGDGDGIPATDPPGSVRLLLKL